MQHRHSNKQKYFEEQITSTRQTILPYIQNFIPLGPKTRVLEVGCGHGGNLIPFIEKGCNATGVDLSENWIKLAHKNYKERGLDHTQIILKNIYDFDSKTTFDFIFLKDVIEHIHDQGQFMSIIKQLLAPNGKIFFAFPPWQMPYGGHQQICKGILSKLPWFHLLPMPIYKGILRLFGEKSRIKALSEIKQTGISIERFEKILKKENYNIVQQTHWLINPNYEIKFGLKRRTQLGIIKSIPYLRNYFTTCSYYLVSL